MRFGPEYRVDIEDTTGEVVAQIRDFISLNFSIAWSGKGNYQLSMSGFDDRVSEFGDDYHLRVWLRNRNFGLDWIDIFTGFVKTKVRSLSKNGNRLFQVYGPSLEELIDKEKILWYSGSTQATKSGAVSTIMEEFIIENIGASALAANGRDADGVVTGLTTLSDGSGSTWSGSRSRKPLLKTLEEMRAFSVGQGDIVDFRIVRNGGYAWLFQCGKLGVDRTTVGLDPTTGLNGAGNVPITFSEGQHNVDSLTRSKNRSKALTEVISLGKGKGITRSKGSAFDAAGIAVSPIARRVGIVTSNTDDQTELDNAADERLRKFQPDDKFTFEPRDIGDEAISKGGTVLFRDYFPGDYITGIDEGDVFHKQVIGVTINISKGTENIVTRQVEFADV